MKTDEQLFNEAGTKLAVWLHNHQEEGNAPYGSGRDRVVAIYLLIRAGFPKDRVHRSAIMTLARLVLHDGQIDAIAGERARADQATPKMSVDQFREAVGAERASHAGRGYDTDHDRLHGVPHLLRWSLDYASRGEAVKSGALIVAALHLSEELEREERGLRARADQAEQRIADAPHASNCSLVYSVWKSSATRCTCWKSAAPTAEQEADE